MRTKENYPRIQKDESLRETILHGREEYPFAFYMEDIWEFDFHCIDWHWHPEVEFVYVKKGKVSCCIGSARCELEKGQGIFVNRNVVHRYETACRTVFPNIVFSPYLLAPEHSLLAQKYILPVLNSPMAFQVYSPEVPWQKDSLELLLSVFEMQDSGESPEWETTERLMRLWKLLYDHAGAQFLTPVSRQEAQAQARLQIMMQFIHANYQSRISLEDIAKAAMLSKSTARNIFHICLHSTPVLYLIHYRLSRAAKLLSDTDLSAATIAYETGFENNAYFCRKFKEYYQVTPGEYRKQATSREKR